MCHQLRSESTCRRNIAHCPTPRDLDHETCLIAHDVSIRDRALACASARSSPGTMADTCRMRFARLSRIRAIMGCPPQENLRITPDIVSVVEDDDYVILDLVLNWVGVSVGPV